MAASAFWLILSHITPHLHLIISISMTNVNSTDSRVAADMAVLYGQACLLFSCVRLRSLFQLTRQTSIRIKHGSSLTLAPRQPCSRRQWHASRQPAARAEREVTTDYQQTATGHVYAVALLLAGQARERAAEAWSPPEGLRCQRVLPAPSSAQCLGFRRCAQSD